jgi:hypothetical protein
VGWQADQEAERVRVRQRDWELVVAGCARRQAEKLEGRGKTDLPNVNGVFCCVEGGRNRCSGACVWWRDGVGGSWKGAGERAAVGEGWLLVARLFDGCFYEAGLFAAEGTTLVEEVYAGFS